MNTLTDKKQEAEDTVLFLSDVIGKRVLNGSAKIGKLQDLAIIEQGKLPLVTHLVVHRPFGRKPLLVPWERVAAFNPRRIIVDLEAPEQFEDEPEDTQVLLNDHIVDKKVLDMDDNEIDIVYDVKLVLRSKSLYVTDVDFSRYALFKRLGLEPLMKLLFSGSNLIKKDTLSWSYVQALPEHLGSFSGNVKLNVLKEKLTEIPPVDLADILEELSSEQRLAVFNQLETEHASDTLEEIEPRVQRELISSIKKDRAAELINAMTPAQAADILAILPAADADDLLKLIDMENAGKIQYMLDKQDEKIANLATSDFIKLPPDTTVGYVEDRFPEIARDKEEIMYIYVVDEKNVLLGVVDLKEVLKANNDHKLADIMTTNMISLNPDNTLLEAAEMFSRYSFRAIPVTDSDNKVLGVIPYRDIMKLKHRFV